jgi:small nuclear ribonucleoprotein (snRNP)-like protein
MLVELKNGETLNGHLVMCDTWMNLTLKEVVQTSPVRWRLPAPCAPRPDLGSLVID